MWLLVSLNFLFRCGAPATAPRNVESILTEYDSIAEPMMVLAQRTQDKRAKIEMYRRVAAAYPRAKKLRWRAVAFGIWTASGKAFDVAFTDAISGRRISSDDFRGKILIVDFWATWCGTCRDRLPELKGILARHRANGVEAIAISLDMPEEKCGLRTLRKFAADHQLDWPQWYQRKGWDSDFSRSWGVEAIPTVFIIDREGRLLSASAEGRLSEMIEKMLYPPAAQNTK